MLEKEYEYYQNNKADIISKFLNKHIVIKGNEILGVYGSLEEALSKTLIDNDLGTFLVKLVEKEEQVTRFYNRVFT